MPAALNPKTKRNQMKRPTEPKEPENPELLEQFITDVRYLWGEAEKKFMQALEDNERRTIMLTFGCVLDLSEQAPVFDTKLSFKDKDTEAGMDVIKSFSVKRRTKFEDPSAPLLPGIEGGDEGGNSDGGRPDPDPGKPKKSARGAKPKAGKKKVAGKKKAAKPARGKVIPSSETSGGGDPASSSMPA